VDVVPIPKGQALGVSQRADWTIVAFGTLFGTSNFGGGPITVR